MKGWRGMGKNWRSGVRVGRLGGAECVQQKAAREVCGEVTCVIKENERRPIWEGCGVQFVEL